MPVIKVDFMIQRRPCFLVYFAPKPRPFYARSRPAGFATQKELHCLPTVGLGASYFAMCLLYVEKRKARWQGIRTST